MRLLTLLLLLLGTPLLLGSPLSGGCGRCPKSCPAGQYLTRCKCKNCTSGTYTSDQNCETSCHRCFSDCRADLHLRVFKECTTTSNLQCECEEGFVCIKDPLSTNCRSCVPRPPAPVNAATNAPSRGQSSTWPQPCSPSNRCNSVKIFKNATAPRDGGDHFGQNTGNKDTTQNQLTAILCPLAVVGGLGFMLVLCFGCPGHETRFKQAVKKLCTIEAKDSAHRERATSCQKHQTVPMASANMGPVHVHNPGTVIFSLLSDISGQIGQTKEEKAKGKDAHDEDAYCIVCQPAPSPSVPLSEEEHPGEQVFFPAQEQGKDSRVSMEEQL